MEEVLLKIRGVADFSDVKSNVNTLQGYLKKLDLPTDITRKLEGSFSKLDKELETFQQHLNSGFKTKGDVTGLEKSGQRIVAEFEKIESTIEGIDTSRLKEAFQIDDSKLKQATAKVNNLRQALKEQLSDTKNNGSDNGINSQIAKIQQSLNKLYSSSKSKKLIDFKEAINSGDLATIKSQLSELQAYGERVFGTSTTEKAKNFRSAITELNSAFNSLKPGDELYDLNQQLNLSEQEVDQLTKELDNLRTQATQDLSSGIKNMASAQDNLNRELLEGARSSQNFNEELGQVKSQIQYYFSLVNVAQLLRRAFQNVVETVKTLDEAMTQTAVVTDFTVGDMWEKLPEYTTSAKALGVATHELYEATTLYYQQGLDTNASMAAGIETMKMAKIAGMEAAVATDAMTAALRGFNMEVNEENAQRVNDVYSKLAAITASDTEEIATAMSKTASIASSVGAEFENIAVFLAQAIETTRESADSIGTAMKTVLARFNELTKDPAEIGEIDGEIVDANKVEKALRSVGIALTDTNGQFRDADQVLLEVAQKWDSMSIMQQRYIATQAAGSRQQSRFIAMMSNYNRTMELQEAAYNATGASQAQYEKTLESLDSKLNKLKNTWDEFILGIANNSAIKGTVDALSGLLNIINKMTNLPGILGGISKGLLAFGAFGGVKTLVNSLASGLEMGKAGLSAGTSFSSGFVQGFSSSIKSSGKGTKQSFETLFGKSIQGKDFAIINTYNEALLNSANARTLVAKKTEAFANATDTLYDSMTTGVDIEKANAEWIEADIALTDARVASKNANMAATSAELALEELSNGQQEQALLLTQAGIKSDLALIATAKGLTLEELKKAAAQKLGNEATEEEIRQEMEKIILSKMSLAEKIKLKLATLQGTVIQKIKMAQDKKEITGITAKIAAFMAEKFAIDAVKAATISMIIVTTAAALAVVTLVGAVVWLAKVAKENSLEYKMEQAAEATKRAESAAKAAKDAYEDLVSSKEEFDEFQSTLEDLTYGTLEWKKALVDANQQVLDLLKTYPTLANYISENDQGVLTISEEGWNTILEKQMQNVETSQNALTVSQYQEHQLSRPNIGRAIVERSTDSADNVNEEMPSFIDWVSGLLLEGKANANSTDVLLAETVTGNNVISSTNQAIVDQTQTELDIAVDINQELLKAMEQGQDILNKESAIYGDLMNRTLLEADEILEYAQNLKATQTEIEQFATQSAIYAQQIGGSTKEIANLEEGEDLAWILGQRFTEEYDEIAATITVPDTYEKAVQEYASALGVSADYIKEQYSKDDLENLKKDLKNFKFSEEINKKSKEFAEAWVNFGNEAQEKISALLSQGGKSLTQDQIDAFSLDADGTSKTVQQKKEYLIKTLGITDENISLFGYDTIDDMIAAIEDNITTATVAFESSKEELIALTSKRARQEVTDVTQTQAYDNLIRNMTSGTAKAFNDSLSSIMVDMGTQGVDSYLHLVDSLTDKLSAGGQKKLLENLSLINLQDIENAEDLREALDSIGISAIELTDDELKELNEEIQAMAAVASKTIVDIDKAKKAIDAGVNSKKILQEAIDDNEIEFSEEDYETLKAAGASSSDFFYDGETYTYLGDTVDLLQKINADTAAMRAKLLAQVEQDTIDGATIADWIAQDKKGLVEFEGEKYTRESLIYSALADEVVGDFTAKKLMEEIYGVNTTGWADAYAKAQLQFYYDKYGTGGTTYTGNLVTLETMYDEQYGAIAASQSGIENAEMYEQASAEFEKYQGLLEKNGKLTEQQTIAQKEAKTMMEKSTQALKAKGKALGMTDKELDEYLGEGGKGEGLLGQVIAEKQLETNLKKTTDATKDYFDALANGATGIDRDNALAGIAKEADLNLGLEVDVDWLKEADNLEAFRKAINGTKEDYYDFITGLKDKADDFLGIANSAEEVSQAFTDAKIDVTNEAYDLSSIVSMLDNLSFDIDGTADFTQIYNAIYAVTQDAAQAQAILQQLAGTGVAFDIKYEDQWMELPIGQTQYQTSAANGSAGDFHMIDRQAKVGYSWQKVKVPKVVGHVTGGGSSGGSSFSSSGGGGGGSSDKYEPDYDKYYNTLEKIAKLQEDRTILQEEYDELLEDENASLTEIQAKQDAIVKNLREEKKYQDQIVQGRLNQIRQEQKENSDLTQYAWFDEKLGKVQINWDKINTVTDSEKGERIDNYISNLEEYADGYNDARENSRDIDKEITELIEVGKNDLDDSFNTLEKLERIENEITNLQAERNILMEDASENSKAILESYAKEKELLDQQLEVQKKLNEERIAQHNENLEKAQEVGIMQYITDMGEGQFTVDQTAIDQMSQDKQDFILEWLDKLNESGDAVQETTEQYLDAAKQLKEFRKELKGQAVDFFSQVKEALINDYQEKIDNLSKENEAISETTTKLFDSIQKSLSEERQNRENKKTEEDISDKEARLAYLQADTTGANALEIKNLQKEISEQKEDYTDTLIDQKISELQEQNDEAAAQREVQIELAQAQLDQLQKSGGINDKVQELIDKDVLNGEIVKDSTLYKLLNKSTEEMTKAEAETYWNDTNNLLSQYSAYLKGTTLGEEGSKYKEGDDITSEIGGLPSGAKAEVVKGGIKITLKDGKTFTAKGAVEDLTGNINFSFLEGMQGYFKASDARKALRAAAKLEPLNKEDFERYDIDGDGKITAGDARSILRNAAQLENIEYGDDRYSEKDFFAAVELMNEGKFSKLYDLDGDGELTDNDLDSIVKNFGLKKKYATGGLADFTGPAWLDGTKSRPELVLNARDTQNFIELKDILSSVLKNVGSTKKTDEKNGDTYYEIHIDVEKLSSDYDVDDVANRVKTIIAQDAMYRNNNIVNRLR